MTDRTGWQRFFDNHAPDYHDNVFTKNTPAEIEFLLEELRPPAGARILDVACGTGRHAIPLAARGFQVVGIDLSAGMLEQAQAAAAEAGVEIEFRQADATEFTIDEPCDAAICICEGAFGLLASDDDPIEHPLAILRCVAGALKPGSPAIFTVLNGYRMAREFNQVDVTGGNFDPLTLSTISECNTSDVTAECAMRERGFMPTELRLLFDRAGFSIEHIWGGTAGNWRRGPIDLDEFEVMVVARKR